MARLPSEFATGILASIAHTNRMGTAAMALSTMEPCWSHVAKAFDSGFHTGESFRKVRPTRTPRRQLGASLRALRSRANRCFWHDRRCALVTSRRTNRSIYFRFPIRSAISPCRPTSASRGGWDHSSLWDIRRANNFGSSRSKKARSDTPLGFHCARPASSRRARSRQDGDRFVFLDANTGQLRANWCYDRGFKASSLHRMAIMATARKALSTLGDGHVARLTDRAPPTRPWR